MWTLFPRGVYFDLAEWELSELSVEVSGSLSSGAFMDDLLTLGSVA